MAEVMSEAVALPAVPVIDRFRRTAQHQPQRTFIRYRGEDLSFTAVDRASSAVAVRLGQAGVGRGDRIAVLTQNIPDFVITTLAAWKRAASYVPLSPMLRRHEIHEHLQDSGALVLVVEDSLLDEALAGAVGTAVQLIVVCGRSEHYETVAEIVRQYKDEPILYEPVTGQDVAILSYTSGTTGRPKAALTTHGNIGHNTEVWIRLAELTEDDVVAGVAPLFHITGPPAIFGVAAALGIPMVLDHRFEAGRMATVLADSGCTFALASITAFRALLPHIAAVDLSRFTKVFSGGAPVPSATVSAWQQAGGKYIHNCYGLTETTSPTVMVPLHHRAPIDPESGALAVGRPIPGTVVRTVDPDTGLDVAVGAPGELLIRGPGVVPGYWQNAAATSRAFTDDGFFRTGDIAVIDAYGWVYIVDRLKDMIIASGFKVWPREVEDVLHRHPAVAEVAVIGVPDEYRGESVCAVVQLQSGKSVTAEELIAYSRSELAAYKYPRYIRFVREIPQTASGKVRRNALRGRFGVIDAR